MGYPPPPPPPGSPGYGPPTGPPPGPPGYGPPPGAPPPGGPGYGGPGGPGGYAPTPPPAGGSGSGGSKSLIILMAALVVVVLVAVAGGLILLNRDSGGDVELTEAQLEEALITEGDVGEGFTRQEDDSDDSDDTDEFDRDEIDASQECLDLYEEIEGSGASEPDVEVEASFDGEDGSQVESNLSQGSDVTLDTMREFADTCGEVSIDDGESVGTLRFAIVDDVVEVGDESLTLEITVDFDEPFDITVTSLGVLWERSGTHATVSVYGAVDDETLEASEPDEGLLRDVVERADEKLAEVIDEA